MGFLQTIYWGIGLSFAFVVIFTMFHMGAEKATADRINVASDSLADRMLVRFPSYQNMPLVKGDTLVLMMDTHRRTALLGTGSGVAKEIPFDSFVSAEILTDGQSLTETKRSGMLGRAVVGGAIGGGVGAVIGAISAGSFQRATHNITSISVFVTTSDAQFPYITWNIFQPHGVMQDLKPHEVWPHMMDATALYNQLAPVFKLTPTADNGLVSI
ncbi:MAG: hypothetical protein JWS10_642 [Cypionkella sp.]|nr:hypothetical protein [Cypionkella sp.]